MNMNMNMNNNLNNLKNLIKAITPGAIFEELMINGVESFNDINQTSINLITLIVVVLVLSLIYVFIVSIYNLVPKHKLVNTILIYLVPGYFGLFLIYYGWYKGYQICPLKKK